MTGTIQHCALCQFQLEDADGMNVYQHCELLNGGACPACKDYVALEARISATKQLLNDLIGQRPHIRTKINQNHDMLTTCLPTEVVCSVFEFCVPSEHRFFNDIDDTVDNSGFLWKKKEVTKYLLLGRICKAWRDIAWATAPLWTFFRLYLDDVKASNSLDITREWLERAGQLQVSISILGPYNRSDGFYELAENDTEAASQLIEIINERSKQWKNLQISGPAWLISAVKGSLAGASGLQTIWINADDANSKFSLLNGMPQPSYLRVDRCRMDDICIDWTHLTRVYLLMPSMEETIELLHRAPNLVKCKFSSITMRAQNVVEPHSEPIIHQNLESLEFTGAHRGYNQELPIIMFLKSFTLPNLQHLIMDPKLWRDRHIRPILWDPLLSHIATSSPPLISLCILHSGPDVIRDIILPVLHMAPLLHHLEMLSPWASDSTDAHNAFLQLLAETSMTRNDNQARFLPNLQSLTFKSLDEHGIDHLWEAIPAIFGPISEIHDPRRRPLKVMNVRVMAYGMDEVSDLSIKSKDLVLQLLRLRREGITLCLERRIGCSNVDILRRSIELHGLAPDDPIQI